MTSELDRAKYISFTSYKHNGDAVSLPVWVAPFEGGYAFTSDADAFKVKRVRNNTAVTVQVCSLRGKPAQGSVVFSGTAEVLEGEAAQRVRAVIRRKYRIVYLLAIAPSEWWAKLRKKADDTVAIKVTLTDPA